MRPPAVDTTREAVTRLFPYVTGRLRHPDCECHHCQQDAVVRALLADLDALKTAISPRKATEWSVRDLAMLAECHREDSEAIDRLPDGADHDVIRAARTARDTALRDICDDMDCTPSALAKQWASAIRTALAATQARVAEEIAVHEAAEQALVDDVADLDELRTKVETLETRLSTLHQHCTDACASIGEWEARADAAEARLAALTPPAAPVNGSGDT